MIAPFVTKRVSVLVLAMLAACATDREGPVAVIGASNAAFDDAPWSEPVNLGAPVNSPVQEQNPALSPDELSLYFVSNRTDLPGEQGGNDIWVSQRACLTCPWGTPVNLGPTINTPNGDAGPNISQDGHLLFFTSNRPDETGTTDNDLYVSDRADPRDDFGWGAPVKLGPGVNSTISEFSPQYLPSAGDGEVNFYFQRGLGGGSATNELYMASVSRNGETFADAVPIAELNDPTTADGGPSVRRGGREILFNSGRAGRIGSVDIWVSTRPNVGDAWSPPQNVGTPVNNPIGGSRDPDLSLDGRTLVFMTNRPGSILNAAGNPSDDIWISIRERR